MQELLGGANVNIHIFSTTMAHINGKPEQTAMVRNGTARKFYNESDFHVYSRKGYFVHLDNFPFVYWMFCIFWCAFMWIYGVLVPCNFPCALECHQTNSDSLGLHSCILLSILSFWCRLLYTQHLFRMLCSVPFANIEIELWAPMDRSI